MNIVALREVVLELLTEIAPQADIESLQPDVDFTEQLEIDVADLEAFVQNLRDELGVEIPEDDYPELASLEGCILYLAACVEDDDE